MLKDHPDNQLAGDAARRLTPVVTEQREKLKEEMFGAGPVFRRTAYGCNQACCSVVSARLLLVSETHCKLAPQQVKSCGKNR